MKKNNLGTVRIVWEDAISYRTGDTVPHSMSIFETTGLLVKEDGEYVVIERPVTIDTQSGKNYPDKTPTFYFIPRCLITKMESMA